MRNNKHTEAYYRTLKWIDTLDTKEKLIKGYNEYLNWMKTKGWIEFTGGVNSHHILNFKYTVKFHIDAMKDKLQSNM